MNKVSRIKLKNGLRLLVVPNPESLATTIYVFVATGSKYEDKKTNGLSHFLEHMCFKSTRKRPRPIDIASDLDGIGAQYNALTTHEYTGYYAKVQNSSFQKAFDVISDLYLHPVFRDDDVNTERGVITEEINMYEDSPKSKVGEIFMELLYGNQPAGRSVLGTKENIAKFSKNDLISYRKNNYLPCSTVVVISGKISASEAASLVKKEFSLLARGEKMSKLKVVERQNSPAEKLFYKKSEQSHLMLGLRTFPAADERRYSLSVLAEVLGGGMSSRLFKKVRDELGAAYYVRAETDFFSDHGFLSVDAGVDHRKLEAVIAAIVSELKRLKKEKVGDIELIKAKEHLIGDLFLSIETSDALGYFYGTQEIMDMKPSSPFEIARKIRQVTSEDILKTAGDIVKNNRLNMALVGPFKNRSFADILKV